MTPQNSDPHRWVWNSRLEELVFSHLFPVVPVAEA